MHSFSPEGDYYVTSPNMAYVPTIIQGIVHVQRRPDGRYGPADPLVSPQIHVPCFAYVAAVLKQVPSCHPYHVMWCTPFADDFEALTGTPVTGLGFLRDDFISPFVALARDLSKRIIAHGLQTGGNDFPMLRWHELLVSQALSRLRLMPASFADQTLQLRTLQRHFLFANAYLEYFWRVRHLGCLPKDASPPSQFMGAWSSSAADVHILSALGLPVWLVRQSVVPAVRSELGLLVQSVALPEEARCPCPGAPSLYTGLVGEKHLATILYARPEYLDVSCVPSASSQETMCPAPPVSQAIAHKMAAASKARLTTSSGQYTDYGAPRKKKRGRGGRKPCTSLFVILLYRR